MHTCFINYNYIIRSRIRELTKQAKTWRKRILFQSTRFSFSCTICLYIAKANLFYLHLHSPEGATIDENNFFCFVLVVGCTI